MTYMDHKHNMCFTKVIRSYFQRIRSYDIYGSQAQHMFHKCNKILFLNNKILWHIWMTNTTYVSHMFYICFTYVLHMFHICFTYVLHVFHICFTYVLHMFHMCFTYVLHMFHICFTYVSLMFDICFYMRFFMHCFNVYLAGYPWDCYRVEVLSFVKLESQIGSG